ncbi:hypothetical protein [Streptomyces sp. NPDC089799]|uniref:hypothetical protein n=1 Tax=Streptomyces sp. NPDC089799 TaxID=3155066 RepID=UPI003418E604
MFFEPASARIPAIRARTRPRWASAVRIEAYWLGTVRTASSSALRKVDHRVRHLLPLRKRAIRW